MQNENQRKLNNFKYYFVKSLEFYNLKKDIFAKTAFIINLVCIFTAFKIPAGLMVWQVYGAYYVLFCISALSSTLYLNVLIKELRGKSYDYGTYLKRIRKKAGTVLFASTIYLGVCIAGLFALIIPCLFFISVYFLNSCYIIDLGESISDSYEASKRLTKPFRDILFKYFLMFFLIVGVAGYMFLTMMATSGSELIVICTIAFLGAAAILMYQRFVAYIYLDIEYRKNELRKA